jgi:transposase
MSKKKPQEQEHHKKAFEFYYSLGETRNYGKVARKFGVSVQSIKLWGQSFNWRKRVNERDAEVVRIMATKAINKEVSSRTRNLQIVQMALVRLAKAIAEDKIKMTLADLDRLIRLESFLTEGVDSRQEVLIEGLENRPLIELQSMIKQEIRLLEDLGIMDEEGQDT